MDLSDKKGPAPRKGGLKTAGPGGLFTSVRTAIIPIYKKTVGCVYCGDYVFFLIYTTFLCLESIKQRR